mmetsp:Transcript_15548/g.20276  ORF Transcript_15548/g.20276 Transcript_15548/m.20276 type:complete len:459 (+) Transcript_15548:115-1491(+)
MYGRRRNNDATGEKSVEIANERHFSRSVNSSRKHANLSNRLLKNESLRSADFSSSYDDAIAEKVYPPSISRGSIDEDYNLVGASEAEMEKSLEKMTALRHSVTAALKAHRPLDLEKNSSDITATKVYPPARPKVEANVPEAKVQLVDDHGKLSSPNGLDTGNSPDPVKAIFVKKWDPNQEDQKQWYNSRLVWTICIIAIVLATTSIVISLSVDSSRDDEVEMSPSNLSMNPSSSPYPTIYPTNRPSNERSIQIRTRIEGEGGTSATLLDDFSSGQSKALTWLTFEDSMQLDPSDENLLQRYALATIYFATQGERWYTSYNWLTDADECVWSIDNGGVSCHANSSQVSKIDLGLNNLIGTFPGEIGILQSLNELDFSQNSLGGSISEKLGTLNLLEYIDLSLNYLTGTIPTSLSEIENISTLFLYKNELSGTVPEDLCYIDYLWIDCEMTCSCCSFCIP